MRPIFGQARPEIRTCPGTGQIARRQVGESIRGARGPRARFADVSMVLTLAGAGTMTWLYLKEGKGQSRGEITPLIAPGAVGVQGSF
jgi:hypothetical protein